MKYLKIILTGEQVVEGERSIQVAAPDDITEAEIHALVDELDEQLEDGGHEWTWYDRLDRPNEVSVSEIEVDTQYDPDCRIVRRQDGTLTVNPNWAEESGEEVTG